MKRPNEKKTTKATGIVKRRLPLKFRCLTPAFATDLPSVTSAASAVTRQVSDEDLDGKAASTASVPPRLPMLHAPMANEGFSPLTTSSLQDTTARSISDNSLDRNQALLKRRAKSLCLADLAPADTPVGPPKKDAEEAAATGVSPKTVAGWGLFVDFPDEKQPRRVDRRRPFRFRRRVPLKGFVLAPPNVDEAANALGNLCVSRSF